MEETEARATGDEPGLVPFEFTIPAKWLMTCSREWIDEFTSLLAKVDWVVNTEVEDKHLIAYQARLTREVLAQLGPHVEKAWGRGNGSKDT